MRRDKNDVCQNIFFSAHTKRYFSRRHSIDTTWATRVTTMRSTTGTVSQLTWFRRLALIIRLSQVSWMFSRKYLICILALEKRHRTVGQRAVKLMKKRIPITRWLPRYQKSDIIGDAVAGITVGMTVVPQSIAYVSIAGLSPEVKSNKYNFFLSLNSNLRLQ